MMVAISAGQCCAEAGADATGGRATVVPSAAGH
jgi:hypothetical protein